MSVITFPSALRVRNCVLGQQRLDVGFSSIFGSQDVEVSSPLWELSFEVNAMYEWQIGPWQAYLLSLKGRVNQTELWNFARPYPLGTMRGVMTLNGAHAQGVTTLNITAAGEAGKTLKQGDFLGLGAGITKQLVMVMADAAADGLGNITVVVESALRNGFTTGAAVTWNKPTALFRRKQSKSAWAYQPGLVTDGFTVEFIEDTRA